MKAGGEGGDRGWDGWHHWLDGHEFEQALGAGDGQGSLECCSPWDWKEPDMTEQLNCRVKHIWHYMQKNWHKNIGSKTIKETFKQIMNVQKKGTYIAADSNNIIETVWNSFQKWKIISYSY